MKSIDLTGQQVVALRDVETAAKAGATELLMCSRGILTPSARDFIQRSGLTLRKAEKPAADAKPAKKAKKVKKEKKEEAGAGLLDQMAGVNLAPPDAAEKQALAAVKEELGLNDSQLSELKAAPMPAHDKVAAAKAVIRAAILSKVAALQN